MLELGSSGSVRGVSSNGHPYRDQFAYDLCLGHGGSQLPTGVSGYKPWGRILTRATDLCATEPARVAQQLADRGLTPRYDSAFQTLSENGYKWREYDAEDTIRFYALRFRDTGFIKSSPQKIIAEGTDWRFLDELKRELKA
jgi:hypothetical protein